MEIIKKGDKLCKVVRADANTVVHVALNKAELATYKSKQKQLKPVATKKETVKDTVKKVVAKVKSKKGK